VGDEVYVFAQGDEVVVVCGGGLEEDEVEGCVLAVLSYEIRLV
jgi:hypothetical protein